MKKLSVGHDPINDQIAFRIRRRRMELGFSIQKVAEHLGISGQQLQKYENRSNRISASKLLAIANFLESPIQLFFDGILEDMAEVATHPGSVIATQKNISLLEIKLLSAFDRIDNSEVTLKLYALIRALGTISKSSSG